MKIEIKPRLADVLREWAKDEADAWPSETMYQEDLADLLRQLDEGLPTARDVRGIMSTDCTKEGQSDGT